MQKHIRYIENRTGRRPFVCNVNKKAKSLTPAWRATLGFVAYLGYLQGRGDTRNGALLGLVKAIKGKKSAEFKQDTTNEKKT